MCGRLGSDGLRPLTSHLLCGRNDFMKRSMLAYLGGLTCVALLASATAAKALMIAPQPVPMRVAAAELVVVGKVTGFADKLVKVKQSDDDMNPIEYQVAIVKVQKALIG